MKNDMTNIVLIITKIVKNTYAATLLESLIEVLFADENVKSKTFCKL